MRWAICNADQLIIQSLSLYVSSDLIHLLSMCLFLFLLLFYNTVWFFGTGFWWVILGFKDYGRICEFWLVMKYFGKFYFWPSRQTQNKEILFIYLFIFFCNYNSCYCSFDVQEAVILWHFYCLLQLCMALDWQHLLIMLFGQLQVHYVGERERENPEVHESIKFCRCVAGNLLLLSTLNMPWFSIQLN